MYSLFTKLLLLGVLLLLSSEIHAVQIFDGYYSNFSVAQGGSIDLYASGTDSAFSLTIFKGYGSQASFVTKIDGITGAVQTSPSDNAWQVGAGWSPSTTINVDANWESGMYQGYLLATHYASLSDVGKTTFFVVKAANPGSTSKILVLDNALTNVAYNGWGGKSLYPSNSSGSVQANTVSLLRPGQNLAQQEELEFSNWAKLNNIPLEYASSMDLHSDPTLLSHYNLVVMVGHNEYWTSEMRANLDAFVQNGGNAMILGGNTMWWQARVDSSNNQLVSYKESATTSDPIRATDPSLVTTNWYNPLIVRPENSSIGVSFRNGGYVNYGGHYTAATGNGGYTVVNSSHWLFAATALSNGNVFGQSSAIVGYETDGALYITNADGQPVPTGADGTPLSFEILAMADTYNPANGGTGHATMGIFQPFANGGQVFNASTVNWADGLWYFGDATRAQGTVDPIVSQITKNAINKLQNRTVLPAVDTAPEGFTFTGLTGVALSEESTSNTITVAGINALATISISGGTYSVNGGTYTADTGTVNNGDTVTVRVTSSASYSTPVSTTLTIGGVSGTFGVITLSNTATSGGGGGGVIDPIFPLLVLFAGYHLVRHRNAGVVA